MLAVITDTSVNNLYCKYFTVGIGFAYSNRDIFVNDNQCHIVFTINNNREWQ